MPDSTDNLPELNPDLLLGHLAVERGLISQEQLVEALGQKARETAGGRADPVTLASILVSRGYLTGKTVVALHEEISLQKVTLPPVPKELPPLSSLGKYTIGRELGRGAMGMVYDAVDTELKRRVALKLMLPSQATDPKEIAHEEAYFVREAQLTAKLAKHPNIAAIYEAGVIEGKRYLAMELIEGRPMSEWRAGASLRDQVRVLRDVALAVHEAHESGILHRDLKPKNILMDRAGRPCVTDFGMAKLMIREKGASSTSAGTVVGTPAYMSPEQAQAAKTIDRRADVYALGAMLYEILTGKPPFVMEKASIVALMRIIQDPIPSPSAASSDWGQSRFDKSLEPICMRALAKKPDERFATAREFAEGLSRWLGEMPPEPPPPPKKQVSRRALIAAGAAALGAAAVFVALLTGGNPPADAERGRRLLAGGAYGEAKRVFEEILARDPGSPDARNGRLEAILREDAYQAGRALEAARKAHESAPGEATNDRLRSAEAAAHTAREQLLQFIRKASVPPPEDLPADDAWKGAIDLLALVDPARDRVEGAWALREGKLVSDSTPCARVELPYRPPAEYDLRVLLVRREGEGDVNLILSKEGRPFLWLMGGWGNTVFGFETIGGKRANSNPTTLRSAGCLENAKVYSCVVQVRRDGMAAYLDGRRVAWWKTDFSDLSLQPEWELRDPGLLGLTTYESIAEFHRVDLLEVTGRGSKSR